MKKIILSFALFVNFAIGNAQSENGVIPLVMHNAQNGKTYLDEWIYVDAHNNFVGASFAPLGKVDSLSLAANIPTEGWTDKIAAIPTTGIIAYLKGKYYIIHVDNYVVSTKNAIMGVRIRYRQLLDSKIENEMPNKAITENIKVFITENEDIFGKSSSIIADKLKTEFSKNSCHLTQNAPQSNFQLYIKAITRQINSDRDFYYCYADVTVELFNTSLGESIYFEDFSQKGVSTSRDRAAREALIDAATVISEKIMSYIIKTE